MKRMFATLILVMFVSAGLTACNTMAGAGTAVQTAGETVAQKAEDCTDMKC